MSAVWDPGLQPERTELAWRRTSLSLAAISLLAVRLLPVAYDSWLWAAPGIIGVIASGTIWLLARRRHRATLDALRRISNDELPDGRLVFAMAAVTTASGAMAVLLLTRW